MPQYPTLTKHIHAQLTFIQVSSVRMLSGERVLTASHDGTVKMWDVRTDTCVATVGRCQSAVLCMEYDDSTGILAAAGRDVYVLFLTSKCFWCFDSILAQATWVTSF